MFVLLLYLMPILKWHWTSLCVLEVHRREPFLFCSFPFYFQAWQSSFWFVLEVGIVSLLGQVLSTTSSWSSMSLGLRLLLVSLMRDRLVRLFCQLQAMLAIALSTWVEKKLRRPNTIPLLVLNAVLFPLLCLLPAAIASCLAAPLLPLFTLPIFLIGYSRPSR